jgi:hypothetical protein
MARGSSVSILTAVIAAAIFPALAAPASAQTPAPSAALKTAWGEPDLQGIWTEEFDTPLQRPARYASQEFFTDAQREELEKARSALLEQRPRRQSMHSSSSTLTRRR